MLICLVIETSHLDEYGVPWLCPVSLLLTAHWTYLSGNDPPDETVDSRGFDYLKFRLLQGYLNIHRDMAVAFSAM